MSRRKIPAIPPLGIDALALAKIVASTGFASHPDTVAASGGALFPAIRDQSKRISVEVIDGKRVFLDDNTTPRWATLWGNGIADVAHPKGWTFAHVWPASKDWNSYTHLANLVMIPEFFGSLTDKDSPVAAYFRFHAWRAYSWKPQAQPEPTEPIGFDEIEWRYFERFLSPLEFVGTRISELNSKRAVLLRPIMRQSREP